MEKSIAIKDVQEYVKSKGVWETHMEDKNAWLLKFVEESCGLASSFYGNDSETSRSSKKHDTWDVFDKLVDEVNEKLNFDDFQRCDLSRPLIDFSETSI